MNPGPDLSFTLALIIVGHALSAGFQKLTGMTIEEWDDLNYARIMSVDGCRD